MKAVKYKHGCSLSVIIVTAFASAKAYCQEFSPKRIIDLQSSSNCRSKVKVVPLHAMKAYGEE
jgi:hypothetical protein